jgi:hypothetical protein
VLSNVETQSEVDAATRLNNANLSLCINDGAFPGDLEIPSNVVHLVMERTTVGGRIVVRGEVMFQVHLSGCSARELYFDGPQPSLVQINATGNDIGRVAGEGRMRTLHSVTIEGSGLAEYALYDTPHLWFLDLRGNRLTDVDVRLPRGRMHSLDLAGNPPGLRFKHIDFAFNAWRDHPSVGVVSVVGDFLETLYGWQSDGGKMGLYTRAVTNGEVWIPRGS